MDVVREVLVGVLVDILEIVVRREDVDVARPVFLVDMLLEVEQRVETNVAWYLLKERVGSAKVNLSVLELDGDGAFAETVGTVKFLVGREAKLVEDEERLVEEQSFFELP